MRKFVIIFMAAASGLDAILTHVGVSRGLIGEANPVTEWLYARSPLLYIALKVLLPLSLLAFEPRRLSGVARGSIAAACVVYLFVLLLHGYWISEWL